MKTLARIFTILFFASCATDPASVAQRNALIAQFAPVVESIADVYLAQYGVTPEEVGAASAVVQTLAQSGGKVDASTVTKISSNPKVQQLALDGVSAVLKKNPQLSQPVAAAIVAVGMQNSAAKVAP